MTPTHMADIEILVAVMESQAKLWRAHANDLARAIRKGNYHDQTSRVIMEAEIRVLRRCARQLLRKI